MEQRHGTPARTIMLGGRRVRINVTEAGQEEPETEAETEVEGRGPDRGLDKGSTGGAAPSEVDSCS